MTIRRARVYQTLWSESFIMGRALDVPILGQGPDVRLAVWLDGELGL